MNNKDKQLCIDTLKELAFSGDGSHFIKEGCMVWIMDDRIRLSYNVPGIDKEYFGPPLPIPDELKKIIKSYGHSGLI